MTQEKDVLERVARRVSMPEPALARLEDRLDRRRRNQRVAVAAFALVIAAVAIGSAILTFRNAGRVTPASTKDITARNVSSLRLAWHADTGLAFTPVAEGDQVFAGGRGLNAFAASCATDGRACRPLWTGDPGHLVGVPTISDGTVFVSEVGRTPLFRTDPAQHVFTGAGRLLAFPASCGRGAAICKPSWQANTGGTGKASVSPVVEGGVVYTATSHGVFAFDESCGSKGATCRPLWIGSTGRATPTAIASLGGYLWVGTFPSSSRTALFAFPESCNTTGGVCRAASTQGWGVIQGMSASDGLLFVNTDHGAYALPASCATRSNCRPVWARPGLGSPVGDPTVAKGTAYLRQTKALFAFPATCPAPTEQRCAARWIANVGEPLGPGPLVVADGVVLTGTISGKVLAFPTACETTICRTIWTGHAGTGDAYVSVSRGMLLVGSADGVQALVPSTSGAHATAGEKGAATLFYAILVAALGLAVGRRRWRRARMR
jgi:outer membrane protein assembly factor BamB